MAIVIDGTGSITGLSAGGLPDGSITASDLASSLDLSAKTVTLPAGVGGKIIQVVSATGTGNYAGSNTSYVATALAASITTELTNSKIFVSFSFSTQSQAGGNSAEIALKYSGDSYSANIWEGLNYSYSGSWAQSAGHPTAIHSPNVSAGTSLTYKMYAKATGGSWYINDTWGRMTGRWTAVLMEIAP
jgi:hypothetical protein